MGATHFSGPLMAGSVLDTTGNTAGTVKNVGSAILAQSAPVTQAGTATAATTGICLPANSLIVRIDVLATTAWSGVAKTISIGTSATSTELVSGGNLAAIGLAALNPGTDATRTANWIDVGTSDVLIYALSANTGDGVGVITIHYVQAADITA